MSFIKRTRIISTRVSQDEYEALLRISRENGAHSVSDYVRRMVVGSTVPFPDSDASRDGVAADLAELQRKVDWLVRIVEGAQPTAIEKHFGATQSRPGSRRVNAPKVPAALAARNPVDL